MAQARGGRLAQPKRNAGSRGAPGRTRPAQNPTTGTAWLPAGAAERASQKWSKEPRGHDARKGGWQGGCAAAGRSTDSDDGGTPARGEEDETRQSRTLAGGLHGSGRAGAAMAGRCERAAPWLARAQCTRSGTGTARTSAELSAAAAWARWWRGPVGSPALTRSGEVRAGGETVLQSSRLSAGSADGELGLLRAAKRKGRRQR
ncbi:unnamed protein product [Miscanthus lutarioriparius]|uniref:Uncharacterized protein n=1 Tax=Miscanthus lutarioriparius TaxID=422564 RepID=A0A811P1L3_9POAL|nr:unnamed protein product [Miscanthus lutarioriparius]